jgi:mannose-6-phosphate isomerase
VPFDYVLELEPAYDPRPWGGRRLARWYPNLPPGPVGEAWALSARPELPSTVTNGPLAGLTLDRVLRGHATSSAVDLPVLVKLLDASDDLSIQVHPAGDFPGLAPDESGKGELWFVLHAEPGGYVIRGFKPGVTVDDLADAIHAALANPGRNDAVIDCLRRFPVSPGDVIPIEPGTVHALGGGVVVAEVQQNSDTTYRLWDYNRPGVDGRPRPLHLDRGLAAIRHSVSPAGAPANAAADTPVFRCERAGSVHDPELLGRLPGGVTVGYASLQGKGIEAPAGLLGLLVLEGQVNGASPGRCLLCPPPWAGQGALNAPGGAKVISVSIAGH